MVTFDTSYRGRDLADHYRTLGVTPGATFREIEAAYWRLAFRASQSEMVALNAAYEVLGNDERRRAYDAQRRDAGLDAPREGPSSEPAAVAETPRAAPSEPGLRSRLGWPRV
jgi:molecular chaperone DnaJ